MTVRVRRRRKLVALAGVAALLALFPAAVHGTVEEQRARLPPPAECADPVEGIWMGLKYDPRFRDWNEVTLDIRRVDGGEGLMGQIVAHFWRGTPTDTTPPPCGPGGLEGVVKMPGRGKADRETKQIAFGSSTYVLDKVICGPTPGYAPDNFSGTIDPAIQEFQSVNNDGARSFNDPIVFRRIKCFDPPRKVPTQGIQPPSFWPARRSGCGR